MTLDVIDSWCFCTDNKQRFNVLLYRVSQEEGTKLREGVPYVKIY